MNRFCSRRSYPTIIALGLVALCASVLVNNTISNILYNTPNRYRYNNHANNNLLFSMAQNNHYNITAHQQHHNISAYDYLIICYHKTGHSASRRLTELMTKGKGRIKLLGFGRRVVWEPFMKRDHDPNTKCPHIHLKLGQLNIQAGPDFFCDLNILAEELLHGMLFANAKRGIKIIHMVRNPYTMAVSNYEYHSQVSCSCIFCFVYMICLLHMLCISSYYLTSSVVLDTHTRKLGEEFL